MMKEKITNWITPKRIAFFLTIVYLGSLIPVLWIGWYNYPSADDYSIGSNCRQVWVNSHNLFAVLGAGIARAAEDWVNWMGYFTAQCVWRTVLCIDGMDYGFHAQLIYLVFAQKYLCEGI